ncbi:MAG: cobalamin biosynthesis protein CbiX [Opitutaceae bacterium]|nr:cobalamin biosynthesis protein CbiX [Opitutaceae bacterium]
MKILLVDNGSLEPAATLGLRELARRITTRIGHEVWPVSLAHSHQVPAVDLLGLPAVIVEDFLRTQLVAGETDFVILPFFIGPSRAISVYLPGVAAKLRAAHPALRVRIAPVLHRAGETFLARMLADRVRAMLKAEFAPGDSMRVAVVDHGSPVRAVAQARDEVAAQLSLELGDAVAGVVPCSMERRPEPDYAFNEPLLADLLAHEPWNSGGVIVAQLFLQPGRHAGAEGDIATICAQARAAGPSLQMVRTEPLATHPLMVELLAQRWMEVTAADAD